MGGEGHVIVIYEVKLLDIIMDNALLLDIHIKVVFEKASQKLSTLSRLANYLEPNNLVNKTHEYFLGLILNNYKSG